jgi:beta-phosphoglucomutase-like phosphatase (HAD superfamily)
MSRVDSPSVAAVIFDFDGVLADTERLHLSAFQDVFEPRGWQLDESTYLDRYLGCDDRGLVIAFASDNRLDVSDADIRELVEAKIHVFERSLRSGGVLFSAARTCVERMASRFTLAIASGAGRAEIVSILENEGLRSRFAAIVSADDVTETKPAPMPYLTAARQLGVDPRACVAIEDSPPGLASARAAGMRTVGITTTVGRELLGQADRVIASLSEFSPELVLGL